MARRDADSEHRLDDNGNDGVKDEDIPLDAPVLESRVHFRISNEVSRDEEIVLLPYQSVTVNHSKELIEKIFKDEFARGMVAWRK